mgnify:CR=1 FL=1
MNFYEENYQPNKHLSRKAVLCWLASANKFLTKTLGIKQRLANEARMRELGW